MSSAALRHQRKVTHAWIATAGASCLDRARLGARLGAQPRLSASRLSSSRGPYGADIAADLNKIAKHSQRDHPEGHSLSSALYEGATEASKNARYAEAMAARPSLLLSPKSSGRARLRLSASSDADQPSRGAGLLSGLVGSGNNLSASFF